MKRRLASLVLLSVALIPQSLRAHPVTFKGSFAVMTWNQPFLYDTWISYTFRRDMAVVARWTRMDMPEGNSMFYGPQFDYLVYRWNGDDYQANVYAYGAFGGIRFNDDNGIGGLVGAEADAETRQLYVLGKWESMWTNRGPDFHEVMGRVGVAPYKADFSDLATWVIFQAQYHPSLSRRLVLSPLLRLMYRNFLVEGGASIKGDWMVNGMVHF